MYLPTALPFVSLQRYSNAPTASHSLIHIFLQLKGPRILWSFQNSTDPEEHLYLNKGKCTHSANRKPKLNSLLHLTGRKNKVPAVFHETALKSRLAGYSGENSVAPLSFCSILHGKEKRKLWPRLIAKDKTDTTEKCYCLRVLHSSFHLFVQNKTFRHTALSLGQRSKICPTRSDPNLPTSTI